MIPAQYLRLRRLEATEFRAGKQLVAQNARLNVQMLHVRMRVIKLRWNATISKYASSRN